jgi:putative ABC transport system permease protein
VGRVTPLASLMIFLRSLRRRPLYAALNATGLALGLACALGIGLYAWHELRYDRHLGADVYRVALERAYEHGERVPYATSSMPLAAVLAAEAPEVATAARLFSPRWTTRETEVRVGEEVFRTEGLLFGDPEIADLLALRFLAGDPETALARPDGLILSERLAQTWFGDRDPLGQSVEVDGALALTVAGVIADPPSATHAPVHALAPLEALAPQYGRLFDLWGWDLAYTYVRLRPDANPNALRQRLPDLLALHAGGTAERMGFRYEAALQPVASIHLRSQRQWELRPGSRAAYPWALLMAGGLVLLIAAINFVNLATAQSADRQRDAWIRRVLGGTRRQIAARHLGEAVGLGGLGGAMALGGLAVARPALGDALGLPADLVPFSPALLVGLVLGVSALVGALAGIVPAVRFSRAASPVAAFGPDRLRPALVTVQMAASVVLLVGAAVVHRQMGFVETYPLGFDAERLLVLDAGAMDDPETLKAALAAHPSIEAVTASSGLPGQYVEQMRVRPEGHEHALPVAMLWADDDFADALGLRLAAGRDLDSEAFPSDAHGGFLVNEAAVRAFGWGEGVGRRLAWPSAGDVREGEVVGVLADFPVASLHRAVEPLVVMPRAGYRYLSLRIRAEAKAEAVAHAEAVWAAHHPERPLAYRFLDAHLHAHYAGERRFGRAVTLFTALALLVACLGLFGLAAHTAERRTKEVGIRKALGASVPEVVALLLAELLRPVPLAFALGVPLAWLASSRWLEGYAYRVDLGPGVFLLAGGVALAVASLAVLAHALRAALADPVRALRSE